MSGITRISTGEIKYLLKKYLDNHKFYVYDEFVEYLKQSTYKTFTKPQIGGAVKQLADKGEIERVERGVYQKKVHDANTNYGEKIKYCLKNTILDLSCILKGVDITALSEEEYQKVKKLRVLASQINEVIDCFTDEQDKEAV